MSQSRSSLDDLLDLYESKHKIHVSSNHTNLNCGQAHFGFRKVIGWEHTLSDYEHKSVASTFTSQLQDLDRHHPDTSKLLRILAFFDPESIPLEMLITGVNVIVEAREPPTRSALTASLLALIHSPISRQMPSLASRPIVWSPIMLPLSRRHSAYTIWSNSSSWTTRKVAVSIRNYLSLP
jgi:hypothetical protein